MIAGWSSGAAVAVRAMMQDPEISAGVAIAPAVKPRAGVTAGLPDPSRVRLTSPLLFLCGLNDDVVAVDDCRAWAEAVSRCDLFEVQGANHFFWAKYEDVTTVVSEWLRDLL